MILIKENKWLSHSDELKFKKSLKIVQISRNRTLNILN